MSDTMKIQARKSFSGAEGMWRKHEVKTVDRRRGLSLITKGLGEEYSSDGVKAQRETKPAPPASTPGNRAPARQPQRIPASRTAPAPSTKAGKGGKGSKAAKAGETPPPASEGVQTNPADVITIADGVVTIHAHTHGEGTDSFKVPAGSFKGEPDQTYTVFAFRNGKTPPTGATGDEAVKALADTDGAVLLDVVRIPAAASGNE